MSRNRHKNKNNPKPINSDSYSPNSLGGRIDTELLCSLLKKSNQNDKNPEKSLQTKGKKKQG